MLLFILLTILGWVTFAPPPNPQGRTVLLVVFVVLMVVWLLQGLGAFTLPYGGGKW